MFLTGNYTKDMAKDDDIAVKTREALLRERFASFFKPDNADDNEEDLHG